MNPVCVFFSLNFIYEQGLMDIPLVDGSFTWSSNKDSLFWWSRTDRFLVSLIWEPQFPDLLQKRLPRLCLDHFQIINIIKDNSGQ